MIRKRDGDRGGGREKQLEVDWGNEDLTKGDSDSESGPRRDAEPHTLEIINICTL